MDESLFEWVSHHFKHEWTVVTGAPFATMLAVVIAGIALYWILDKMHEARHAGHKGALAAKDARIDLLDAQVEEYKSKLSGATPEQAAREIANLRENVANTRAELDMIARWWRHHTSARHLTKEQAQALKDGLAIVPLDKRGFFNVGSITEPESQQYAIEILEAFKAADFCSGQTQPIMMWSNTPDDTGVILVVNDANNPPDHAKLALDVFLKAGVTAKLGTASTAHGKDFCSIGVSYKPPLEAISPPA